MSLFSSPSATPEALLRQSARQAMPSEGAKERIRASIKSRITQPKTDAVSLLEYAKKSLEPSSSASSRIWSSVEGGLRPVTTLDFWERLRARLLPSADVASTIWARIAPQLEPVPVRSFHPVKWAAAFAVVAIVVRLSPLLVLAPQTVAESPVTATARGAAAILIGGLWQPIEGELRLQKTSQLSTEEGELTIVLHDDAVIRLAPHTTVTINDLSDRPAKSNGEPTVILEQGTIWVLGFAPKPLRGVTVSTAQGWVTLQEGSLSVKQESRESVTVSAWDRSATLSRRGIAISLLSGEELTIDKNASLTPQRLSSDAYGDPWVSANIDRDAVHQKELAEFQRERRAASAGILPGTRLYPVKRLAENMDVLFTFGSEARTRKVLGQANTRFNEAAAILSTGSGAEVQAQAQAALKEFHDTVLSVATGSGDTVTSTLLESEVVAAATADTSAALPTDSEYVLKQAVRETIASLPDNVAKPDTAAAAALDQVTLAKRHAEDGEVFAAQATLDQVKLSLLENTGSSALLTPAGREEVEATIAALETTVEEQRPDRLPDAEAALTRRADPLLPSVVATVPLTDEQIEQKAQEIRGQIFVFALKRSQLNELREQMRSLERNPDRGRILRRLYKDLPSNGLAQEVRRVIGNLDAKNRVEIEQEAEVDAETGTGSVTE